MAALRRLRCAARSCSTNLHAAHRRAAHACPPATASNPTAFDAAAAAVAGEPTSLHHFLELCLPPRPLLVRPEICRQGSRLHTGGDNVAFASRARRRDCGVAAGSHSLFATCWQRGAAAAAARPPRLSTARRQGYLGHAPMLLAARHDGIRTLAVRQAVLGCCAAACQHAAAAAITAAAAMLRRRSHAPKGVC